MKKILPLLLTTVVLFACNRVERIQSLSQLEPALREHVGNPSRIDTSYAGDICSLAGIYYQFDNVPQVTFEQLQYFLSKAYNSEPVLTVGDARRTSDFVLIKDDSSDYYMVQLAEWYGSKDNKRYLRFCILDVNNELIPPSSPAPQTTALLK